MPTVASRRNLVQMAADLVNQLMTVLSWKLSDEVLVNLRGEEILVEV